MACFSPLVAFKTDSGEIVFGRERGRELKLPCGQCVGCRLERSRQWAVRCMHEVQMHESSCFITLTYSDEFVPPDFGLHYSDFQKFMKRVRARFRARVRFYMCGEYGETYSRPHFHCILFGIDFQDKYYWRRSESGHDLYRSSLLEKLWSFGQCEIGSVTFESAAYIARYCVEKLVNPGAEWIVDPETGELYEREQEFTRMSLKPGIGATWFAKYKSEVYPLDRVVMRGREMKPPRFYDRLMKLDDKGTMSDDVEYGRYLRSLKLTDDNTYERLRTREIVTLHDLKKRRLK